MIALWIIAWLLLVLSAGGITVWVILLEGARGGRGVDRFGHATQRQDCMPAAAG